MIVYCPSCQTAYDLQPEMRGKVIRCKNVHCRQPFEVRDPAESAAPEQGGMEQSQSAWVTSSGSSAGQQSNTEESALSRFGSVGEIIPLLPTEQVPNAESEAGAQTAKSVPVPDGASEHPAPSEKRSPNNASSRETSWFTPPPVRATGARGDIATVPAEPSDPLKPGSPSGERNPWGVEPPPVRRPAAERGRDSAPADRSPPTDPQPSASRVEDLPGRQAVELPGKEAPTPARSTAAARRTSARLLTAAVAAFVVFIAGGLAWFYSAFHESEQELYTRALNEYQAYHYAKAHALFAELARQYGQGDSAEQYQYLGRLSDILAKLGDVDISPESAFAEMKDFLAGEKANESLATHSKEILEGLSKLAKQLADKAESLLEAGRSNVSSATALLEQSRQAEALARRYFPHESLSADARTALNQASHDLATAERQQLALESLARLAPIPESIAMSRQVIQGAGLGRDAEASNFIDRLKQQIFARIQYTPAPGGAHRSAPDVAAELDARSLLIVSPTKPAVPQLPRTRKIVFVCARGVLYALSSSDGNVVWSARVGIDTTALPLQVPPSESGPDTVLVLASDSNIVTCRETSSGRELWQYALHSPCLGRPVLVDNHVYIATYDGLIHELDAGDGKILGQFHLNEPLSGRLTYDENSHLLYVLAESTSVYALDTDTKGCVGILPEGHPTGSLRGRPIVTGADQAAAAKLGYSPQPSYLVLNESSGLEAMKLLAYQLPIGRLVSTPPAQPVLAFPGWSWFPAHFDGEKIMTVTDAGGLGLVGINQANNQDAPLFPVVAPEAPPSAPRDAILAAGSQVVHAEANDLWVLVQGQLQHFRLAIDRQQGLRLVKLWQEPVPLGSALQATQADEEANELFVVTRNGRRECITSAIDAETAELRWQQRVGLTFARDPVAIDDATVVLGQSGELLLFRKGQQQVLEDKRWAVGGQLLGDSLEKLTDSPSLVESLDRKTFSETACVSREDSQQHQKTYELVMRAVNASNGQTRERRWTIPDAVAGVPGVLPNALIVPLANGELFWQPLDGPGRRLETSWRAVHAESSTPGYVLCLSATRFITSDGHQGLTLWDWSDTGAAPVVRKAIQLQHRLLGPPLSFTTPGQKQPTVCAALANGFMVLMRGDDLATVRRWNFNGDISAGPFLRGTAIGCVVNRTRFVLLDPTRDQPMWTYQAGQAEVVGEPQKVDGAFLVADRRGKFVAIDATSGQVRGRPFQLSGTVAPSASPCVYGNNRIFAPLTDGTVLLLPKDHFR